MTAHVVNIWRHPIKAHGREALDTVELRANETMPWDRAWAVMREGAHVDGSKWMPCGHFSRAARNPSLQAIRARFDEETGELELTHPERVPLVFRPDHEDEKFMQWVDGLGPANAPSPARLIRAQERGMTDTPFASVSLLNAASHRAVAQRLGRDISPERWRGNFLIEGLGPWEEFEWIGKRLRIGNAILKVEERIGRCQATSVDTDTGRRDTDMLEVLSEAWDHTDFGVYAIVEKGGSVSIGDPMEVVPSN